MRFAIPDRPAPAPARARWVLLAALAVCVAGRGAGAQVHPDSAASPPPPTTPAPATHRDTLPPPVIRRDTTPRLVGVLRAGDLLRVVVYREKEFSGEYLIDSHGNVQIPGLGEFRVAGLDPTQVKARFVEALRERGFSQPELSVQPLVRVSVLGEVRAPALYPVEPGTSLIQLVTLAGGPLERADLRKTRVVRDGRAFEVDLQSALSGSAAGRVVLYSNDLVVVPRKSGLTREVISFALTTATAAITVATFIISVNK